MSGLHSATNRSFWSPEGTGMQRYQQMLQNEDLTPVATSPALPLSPLMVPGESRNVPAVHISRMEAASTNTVTHSTAALARSGSSPAATAKFPDNTGHSSGRKDQLELTHVADNNDESTASGRASAQNQYEGDSMDLRASMVAHTPTLTGVAPRKNTIAVNPLLNKETFEVFVMQLIMYYQMAFKQDNIKSVAPHVPHPQHVENHWLDPAYPQRSVARRLEEGECEHFYRTQEFFFEFYFLGRITLAACAGILCAHMRAIWRISQFRATSAAGVLSMVIGGTKSQYFQEYCDACTAAFLTARKHAHAVSRLMEIMSYRSNYPAFRLTQSLPEGLPLFCFPNGVQLLKTVKPPTFHTFVQTSGLGARLIGCSLTYYNKINEAQVTSLEKLLEDAKMQLHPSPIRQKKILESLYVPYSLCLCINAIFPVMLGAPFPFIAGVHSSYFSMIDPKLCEEAVRVFLDDNRLEFGSLPPPPPLPDKQAKKLIAEISAAGRLFELRGEAWREDRLPLFDDAFSSASDRPASSLMKSAKVDELVRSAFLKFFISALKFYRRLTHCSAGHTQDWRPFLSEMVRSQMFAEFVDSRLFEVGRNPDVVFFDESIDAKMNRYTLNQLMLRSIDTPFLNNSDSKHTKTYVAPSPDTDNLPPPPDPAGYTYPEGLARLK
ncbi:unnamed protein product [Sphagnum jensenii]|uniref:Uncharacterized protein n=1 Tax=Sphagnum jensenii TaxID=128206 RepID=A0ABP0VFA3_9BRYO